MAREIHIFGNGIEAVIWAYNKNKFARKYRWLVRKRKIATGYSVYKIKEEK